MSGGLKLGVRRPASFERAAIVKEARWAGPAPKMNATRALSGQRGLAGSHAHTRVVVRHLRLRRAQIAREQDVALGPVDLDVAAADRADARDSGQRSVVAAHQHGVAVVQAQLGGVVLAEQNVVAQRAGQRVAARLDHRVELLAAPRGQPQAAVVGLRIGERDRHEAGTPVRAREAPSFAEAAASDLELVAAVLQPGDRLVAGNDDCDLAADRIGVGESHGTRALRPRPGRQFPEDAPLRAGLTDAMPGDLRREDHAALGSGLGDAAGRLVARRHRQQQDVLGRVDEHLRRQHDVHMDAQRHAGQRIAHPAGVGHHLEEVAARGDQDVELSLVGGVQHLRCRQAGSSRDVEAPVLGQFGRARGRRRAVPGQRGRIAAHLGAALHAGVPADRHQPALLASDEPLRQREVDDRAHVVLAEDVLRGAHRPHEHRAARAVQFLREGQHL